MKIIITISQLARGGAERVVCNLANYLSNNNDVTILSIKNIKPEYEIDKKVEIVNVDSKDNKGKISKILFRLYNLNKILKVNKPDIVLSFLPEPSFLVLFLKKIRKTKVIVSVRNDPKVEYKNKLYNMAMKILYPRADGFVFQTEEAQNYFIESIQKKSTIILNSLNPDFIEEPYTGKREYKIVSVGRFFEQKNHEMLIKSFSKIHKLFPEYKLVIYGDGPLRERLEKLINDLNLEKYVELPGIENNIKDKIYKAKVFVLSSNYEGMPNSLMEALSLGVPCISTDCPCGGPRTLIKDGENGILTDVGNIEMLTEKLTKLLSNEETLNRISLNASKIKEKLDPDTVNKQWEDYINKIFYNNF